ncbi:MAG: hypothetical protein FD123_868 [Bacteroidetes bacterium]|nr:MAG: hypothetical protein FD123_868 [Bacteroidota bacterium]
MNTPTTYPFFESGQVLTNVHLNDLRRFLDEHNRLTRVRLSGTGIVCGLGYSYNASAKTITIEAGYGITTSGYLIEVPQDVTYTHFQEYIDPATDNYLYGKGLLDDPDDDDDVTYRADDEDEDESTDVTAFELLTTGTNDQELADWSFGITIPNMVLVLYLELLDEDLKSCTGSNCDNKGMKRTITVRPLLIRQSALLDETFAAPALLPQLNIRKTIYDTPGDPEAVLDLIDVSTSALLDLFFNAISIEQQTVLRNTLENNFTVYGPILDIDTGRKNTLRNAIANLGGGETYRQYVYDALKDITFAWNEMADQFNDFAVSNPGCFAANDYPRHLGLGIVGQPVTGLADAFRNIFRPSPVINRNDERLRIIRLLFVKMEELATSFSVPAIGSATEINPDQPQLAPHSGRSIPYYYSIENNSANNNDLLLKSWSPWKTLRFRRKERYGYFAQNYTTDNYFVEPMQYAQDGHPLLRIEGIKGKNVDDVLEEIRVLKEKYDLAFPVKVLYFSEGTGQKVVSSQDSFNFIYEDLQEDYHILREKPLSLLESLIVYLNSVLPYLTDISKATDPVTGAPTQEADDAKETIEAINRIIGILEQIKERLLELFPACLPDFAENFDVFKDEYRRLIRLVLKSLLDSGFLDGITSGVDTSDPYALHQMTVIDEGVSLVTYLGGLLLDRFWFMKFYRVYVRYMTRKHRSRAIAEPFDEFVQKHCGMEHLAGTYTYGTFIIVCRPDGITA